MLFDRNNILNEQKMSSGIFKIEIKLRRWIFEELDLK